MRTTSEYLNLGLPAGSVRVCWASSGPAVLPPGEDGILWDDVALSSQSGVSSRTARYMQSKAGNTLLAAEMAARYGKDMDGHGRIVSCGCTTRWRSRLEWVRLWSSMLFAGLSPEVAEKGFCFVVPMGQIGKTVQKVEEGIEKRGSGERLWEMCDRMVREFYG